MLVGDPRLGGISATISAYESLVLRGYDVEAIVFFDPSLPLPASTASDRMQLPAGQQVQTSTSQQLGLGNAAAVQAYLMSQRLHKLGMPPTVVMEVPGVLHPGGQGSSSAGHAAHHEAVSGEVSELMKAGLDRELSVWLQVGRSLAFAVILLETKPDCAAALLAIPVSC
jgi:dethiobiotin synthetase/adenosylmethionine--8-amino-7-oxononanoate aminotransferase